MIEITHKQAQRMIREAADRPLPDEQWAMLQAHLESCAECRQYRARLNTYDRDLTRSLRSRWGWVHGPRAGVDERVLKIIADRKMRRRVVLRILPWMLGILALAAFLVYRHANEPEFPPPPPTPTFLFGFAPQVTATPPPAEILFRGLTAFESRRDGNAEIYLMGIAPTGPELTNLSHDPAEDTYPAWSPDGEWVAFLSNRTGKNEIYVVHVAGSRLTQLTDSPDIDWQGPLEWAYDGSYISVTGRRTGAGAGITRSGLTAASAASWLYLVPLDGSGPLSLANSYGIKAQPRFSTTQAGMAFVIDRPQLNLMVGNWVNGWVGNVTTEDSQAYNMSPVLEGAFDWSLGGRSLVYAVNSDGYSEIRFSQDIELIDHQNFTGAGAQPVDSVQAPNRFRAVSWMPHSLMVASLVGSETDNCWTVRLANAYNQGEPPRVITGLCVTGELTSTNWTEDGNWLVLLGRKPGETRSSMYALHMPNLASREDTMRDNTLATDTSAVEQLLDLSEEPEIQTAGVVWNGVPTWAEPHVRPSGRLLNIKPGAVQPANPAGQKRAAFPPAETSGWVMFNLREGQNSQISRVRPDGTQMMKLTGSPVEHSCPRLSPDGQTIAYLSAIEGVRPGTNEVHLMDVDGRNSRLLTNPAEINQPSNPPVLPVPRYDCPVWSPDGQRLAVVLRTRQQTYLAILPTAATAKTPPVFLQISQTSTLSAPVWIPKDAQKPAEGSDEILLVYPQGVQPARIMSVNLAGLDQPSPAKTPTGPRATQSPGVTSAIIPAVIEEKLQLIGWEDVQGLTLSPDGQRLAGVLEYLDRLNNNYRLGRSIAQLRVLNAVTYDNLGSVPLDNFSGQNAGMGGLYWLPDNQVGLARVVSLLGAQKTIFERFTGPDKLETLGYFEDIIYRGVLNQDRWLIFSAESGLWTFDFTAQQETVLPGLLSGDAVFDLDWR